MLVSITGFGSIWRWRLAKEQSGPDGLARAVYYNTTGIEIKGAIRQRPKITGYARFHACGGFNPRRLSHAIGRVFDCADPCLWRGENKLLFKRALSPPSSPDAFLVVTRHDLIGRSKVGEPLWRSEDTWLIAFSECAGQHEAMLLMPAHGWIETESGRFVLEPSPRRPWAARLSLV